MSFDNLKLPGSVITTLYTTPVYHLQDPTSQVLPGKINEPAPLPVLGNNVQYTTLVVSYEDEAFIPERHLAFISKMLNACKMTLADVAIVNNKNQDLRYPELVKQLSPKQLLLFGMEPAAIGLPLSFPELTVQSYNNCNMVHAPTLDMLNHEGDDATPLKKRLWNCLKQMFPIA